MGGSRFYTFCLGEAFSSGQDSEKSLTPYLVMRELTALSPRTPLPPLPSATTFGPQAVALWLCPVRRNCTGKDLLKNFPIVAGL